jgi:hypothetical protein
MRAVYQITTRKEVPLEAARHQQLFHGAKTLAPGTREIFFEHTDIYRERCIQELVKKYYGVFLAKLKTVRGMGDY